MPRSLVSPTENVVLVFKTHLDVGFTESAAKVRHDYINWQLFAAIGVDAAVRERDRNFTWTVGSWVIWEALERHSGKDLARLEDGILCGALAWHALPFTTHSEYLDASLFEFGLSLSRRLDERFGVKTIAAKMTDVPGHTIGIVPLLARAGVRFLHVGVNGACPKPEVPELFRWQSATGEEVLVLYSKTYASDYQHPGSGTQLAFRMFGDNMDIAAPAEVLAWFDELRGKFPEAKIRFGRLDDFATTLEPVRASLPVVTQEIGDTWIHGVASDPLKTKRFRQLARLRREWIAHGRLPVESKAFVDFSKNLLLIGEHTWSIAHAPMLAEEHKSLNNPAFDKVRATGLYQTLEASWAEQRDYLGRAVESLRGTPMYREGADVLQAAVGEIAQPMPGNSRILEGDFLKTCGSFTVGLKEGKAGLDFFGIDGLMGNLRAAEQSLFTLEYQTLSSADYDRYLQQYLNPGIDPNTALDFFKPGLKATEARGQFWKPRLDERDLGETDHGVCLREVVSYPEESQREYGAPATAEVRLLIPSCGSKMKITVSWRGKRATRRPEALWFNMGLALPSPENWRILKLGQEIDPREVVSKGGRKLHATDSGAIWREAGRELRIHARDCAVVSPGKPALGIFDDRFESLAGGMNFLLWNNFWGTNFPGWYDEDAMFEFELEYEGAGNSNRKT